MSVFIFPNQLFAQHPLLIKPQEVWLIEDSLFFGDKQYPTGFHKQKLVYHRSTMKHYANRLERLGHDVIYIHYAEFQTLKLVLEDCVTKGIDLIETLDPVDFMLEKRLKRYCRMLGVRLEFHPNPAFLNSKAGNDAFFKGKQRWFMADFYKHQRKRLGILLEENSEPVGGKWSFDAENRKKLPKKQLANLPALPDIQEDDVYREARAYVLKHFPSNYGEVKRPYYPTTHESARVWLDCFLHERFEQFGAFEDAIVEGESWLYHSVLTPMLNIGLLRPKEVIDASLTFAEAKDIPIASLEGFIRQIIGWREFMRASYEHHGVTMRTSNVWQHENPMPKAFYTAETGVLPIDDSIKRILETAYCHHIERLMVLGGFMFLCEIHPREIYTWFMELFIDSYDWVMVPNVYAMSQNSAGGLITTKPYFSGSNYIRKMSHYKQADWCDTWDGLYWRFVFKHQAKLAKNPRWSMMVSQAKKMDASKKERLMAAAETFLNRMF